MQYLKITRLALAKPQQHYNQWVNWDDAKESLDAIQDFKRLNPDREIHIKASSSALETTSPIRISSMSTSPSPTAHWNFDTEEARDAWA